MADVYTDAPLRAAVRAAATRTLIADLAAVMRRSEWTRDLVRRRLIDHLPVRKAVVVGFLFAVMPGRGRKVPYPAAMILDELERRQVKKKAEHGG